MDFKLENGPWQTFFEGKILGYEVEVLGNANSNLLSVIYEKKDGKKVAAVIEVFRPLHVKGEIEAFMETLPRKMVSLVNHSKQKTDKFLLVDSDLSYVNYDPTDFNRELTNLLEKIERYANVIKEVSRAYDLEIKEVNQCSEQEQQSFFGLPLVSLLVAPKISVSEKSTKSMPIGVGEVMLGITKKGQLVREPMTFFSKTIITGGNFYDRLHVFHVMIESAILSGLPAIVLDFSGAFEKMNYPNPDKQKLRQFGIEYEPIGLPFVSTNAEKIRIDMKKVNVKGLLELFNVEDETVKKIIVQVFETKEYSDLLKAIPAVRGVSLSDAVNDFKKNKAIRILRLINARYKGLFGQSPSVRELFKGWMQGIGKASILRFNSNDYRLNLLLIESLTSALMTEFMSNEKTGSAVIFLEKASSILKQYGSISSNAIASHLVRSTEKGLFFVVEASDYNSLSEKIKIAENAKISIIAGNDIGVQLKGKQSFRVFLRPGISNFLMEDTKSFSEKAVNQHNL